MQLLIRVLLSLILCFMFFVTREFFFYSPVYVWWLTVESAASPMLGRCLTPELYTSAPCTLTLKQQTLLSVWKAVVFVLLLHTWPWWEGSLKQLLRWEVSHSWLFFWEECTPSNLSALIKSEMTPWVKGLAMQAWPLSLILVEGEKAAPTSAPLSSIHVQ